MCLAFDSNPCFVQGAREGDRAVATSFRSSPKATTFFNFVLILYLHTCIQWLVWTSNHRMGLLKHTNNSKLIKIAHWMIRLLIGSGTHELTCYIFDGDNSLMHQSQNTDDDAQRVNEDGEAAGLMQSMDPPMVVAEFSVFEANCTRLDESEEVDVLAWRGLRTECCRGSGCRITVRNRW